MGWSCSVAASKTLDRWTDFCRATTGSSNTFPSGKDKFFIETSRREWPDGAITGVIYRMLDDTHCRKASTFRIDGDGTIVRAPSCLRHLADEEMNARADAMARRVTLGF